MIILSIGVVPENTLAKKADLLVGPRGHIAVSSKLETYDANSKEVVKDVYALGDAIQVKDFVTNHDTAIALAWPANRQARILADIIHGKDVEYKGSMGTSVLKVFNLTVAATGNNQRTAEMKKLPVQAIHAHRNNHASYYPGATNIDFKLVYNPETLEILGAQAIGQDGTEKRIDVIATAIKSKAKVTDLSDLELAYAPPFSSAKDPVNILGYIAENVIEGHYKVVYPSQVEEFKKQNALFLDVRTPIEYETGHIDGALNIGVDDLRNSLDKLNVSKDHPIVVNCQVGLRAYVAIMILKHKGYTNLYNLSGGYSTYKCYTYELNSVNINTSTFVAKVDETTGVTKVQALGERAKVIDVTGMQCPGPLLETYKAVQDIHEGEGVKVIATDPGFASDVVNWAKTNGHDLVSLNLEGNKYIAEIVKGHRAQDQGQKTINQENATLVLFSGELDKALASMIIAQVSASEVK
jgi:rhodanese-related sulfurtransferase/TusA-related sulfurtransferase